MKLRTQNEQTLHASPDDVRERAGDVPVRMPFMPKAGSAQSQSQPQPQPQFPPRGPSMHSMAMPRTTWSESDHPLAPWLNWLDGRLRLALGIMRGMVGIESMSDSCRGLFITPEDIDRLLAQPPGRPLFAGLNASGFCDAALPAEFGRIAVATGLTPFDIAAIVIAAAPELDLRYERLYAFLQDDVNRKRPSVDLVLNLLCGDSEEKLRMRRRFILPAPLLRYGLLQLLPDAAHIAPSLAVHILKPDPQVIAALLGESGIDADLGACAHVHSVAPAAEAAGIEDAQWVPVFDALSRISAQAVTGAAPLRCHLYGDDPMALLAAVNTLADKISRPVLHLDLVTLKDISRADASPGKTFAATLNAAFRHAWMHEAFVCFDRVDVLFANDRATDDTAGSAVDSRADGAADSRTYLRTLLDCLDHPLAICLFTGAAIRNFGSAAGDVLTLSLDALTHRDRRHVWQMQLDRHGLPVDAAATLASRFKLSTGQTQDAVRATVNQLRLMADNDVETQALERMLFAASRLQTRHVFAGLAQLIEPRRGWADLILPDDALAQLHEISSRFLHQDQVLNEWGFAEKLGYGTGTTVLFAGPSGTGKTMAAEVLAHALGLDLYRIDLAAIVSKYIGETEKNLDRLFNAADQANAVLFFDEADALFGKRTEVSDSHDRYANLEVSYLLQKMEQYQGIAILASNLRQNLDEAFIRRLAFIVHFPFPDEVQRRRLWDIVWPAKVRLAGDVDRDELARDLKFSGGNIKNVALAAAFLAAANDQDGVIRLEHIYGAAEREFQKLGRPNSMAKPAKTERSA